MQSLVRPQGLGQGKLALRESALRRSPGGDLHDEAAGRLRRQLRRPVHGLNLGIQFTPVLGQSVDLLAQLRAVDRRHEPHLGAREAVLPHGSITFSPSRARSDSTFSFRLLRSSNASANFIGPSPFLPAVPAHETRSGLRPVRSCRPRNRTERAGLMKPNWAPAAPAICQ